MGLGTVHDYLERAAAAGIVGRCPKAGAKRNWKPSCLGTNRFRSKRRGSVRNRTGTAFMSNCNSIAI
jgi:hypothetical protein